MPVRKKKSPRKLKSRNPVARALRLSKPRVEPRAKTYSRKRLKKPAPEGNGT